VPYTPVIQVLDPKGNEVKLPVSRPNQVMPENVARTISSILSDNVARTPAYGPNSVLNFPTRDVAVKTGTTNDSRDAWTVGYSPNVVVGVWAGNNDNSPMVKKVAGQIVAPMWSSFMKQALESVPDERFALPLPADPSTLKPVMKGIWQGGKTYTIDTITGKLATEFTPPETRKEIPVQSVHSILYWVDKDDPLGPAPINPAKDSQFEHWEAPVRKWALERGYLDQTDSVIPTQTDNIHSNSTSFNLQIQNFDQNKTYSPNDTISFVVTSTGQYQLSKASLYINNNFIETLDGGPYMFRFSPRDISNLGETNTLKVIGYDSVFNKTEVSVEFKVTLDQ
jgi:penicillin-binding protein 1A